MYKNIVKLNDVSNIRFIAKGKNINTEIIIICNKLSIMNNVKDNRVTNGLTTRLYNNQNLMFFILKN